MSEHTPGPFELEHDEKYGTREIVDAEGDAIAIVWARDNAEAAARLFVSAPELLEACNAVLDALGRGGYAEPPLAKALNELTKAVAKAEGR